MNKLNQLLNPLIFPVQQQFSQILFSILLKLNLPLDLLSLHLRYIALLNKLWSLDLANLRVLVTELNSRYHGVFIRLNIRAFAHIL